MENSHDLLVIPARVNPTNNAQDQDDNNLTNNVRHSMRNMSDDNHNMALIQHPSGHGNHGALNITSSENVMNQTMNHHQSGTDNSSWYWQSMLNLMQQHSHLSNNLKIDHGLTMEHISNNDMLQGSVADIHGACIHPLGATAPPDTGGAMWSQEFL